MATGPYQPLKLIVESKIAALDPNVQQLLKSIKKLLNRAGGNDYDARLGVFATIAWRTHWRQSLFACPLVGFPPIGTLGFDFLI